MGRALSLGLAHGVEIVAPFANMDKADVIRLGVDLGVPLERTLSCMNPTPDGRHCGRCSKCRERRDAFVEARRRRSDGLHVASAALQVGYEVRSASRCSRKRRSGAFCTRRRAVR